MDTSRMRWYLHIDKTGTSWHYARARLCDILTVSSKAICWHLLDSKCEYVGNFPTKVETERYIKEQK